MSGTESMGRVAWGILGLRGALGGVLMGLANLVPGVSGGTMLLAAGVYEGFVNAIAELTTLRFRLASLVLLGSIVGAAALAILLLAGPTKSLVVEHRWIMYSLFVGLTLGGVPLVWRMARPATPPLILGGLVGLLVMGAMALAEVSETAGDGPRYGMLFLSGVGGASAMVLPGISGGYLLLILGQYVPILSAIDQLKGALGAGLDLDLLLPTLHVIVPVGLGVVIGVVGVSNLVRWLLANARQATLGVLLGLLLGAVVGLWPFQQGVPPEPAPHSTSQVEPLDPEDWPVERFTPSPGQAAVSIALVLAGLAVTALIDRVGASESGVGQTDSPIG